jgi:hypothetical protein
MIVIEPESSLDGQDADAGAEMLGIRRDGDRRSILL